MEDLNKKLAVSQQHIPVMEKNTSTHGTAGPQKVGLDSIVALWLTSTTLFYKLEG